MSTKKFPKKNISWQTQWRRYNNRETGPERFLVL